MAAVFGQQMSNKKKRRRKKEKKGGRFSYLPAKESDIHLCESYFAFSPIGTHVRVIQVERMVLRRHGSSKLITP